MSLQQLETDLNNKAFCTELARCYKHNDILNLRILKRHYSEGSCATLTNRLFEFPQCAPGEYHNREYWLSLRNELTGHQHPQAEWRLFWQLAQRLLELTGKKYQASIPRSITAEAAVYLAAKELSLTIRPVAADFSRLWGVNWQTQRFLIRVYASGTGMLASYEIIPGQAQKIKRQTAQIRNAWSVFKDQIDRYRLQEPREVRPGLFLVLSPDSYDDANGRPTPELIKLIQTAHQR